MDDSSKILPRRPAEDMHRKRHRRKNVKPLIRPKSAKERSPIKREASPCRLTMYYHGKGVKIQFDKKIFDSKDQITVYQQHCGGENLIVYKGYLDPESLTFFLLQIT